MGMLSSETPTVELRSLQPSFDPSDRNSGFHGKFTLSQEPEHEEPDCHEGDSVFGLARVKGDFRRAQEDRVRNRFYFSFSHFLTPLPNKGESLLSSTATPDTEQRNTARLT